MFRLAKNSPPVQILKFQSESDLLAYLRTTVPQTDCEPVYIDGVLFFEGFDKAVATRRQLLSTSTGCEYVVLEEGETLDDVWSKSIAAAETLKLWK